MGADGHLKPDKVEELAYEHVNWFLRAIRPLLIDHFEHGYKHGREDKNQSQKCLDFESMDEEE